MAAAMPPASPTAKIPDALIEAALVEIRRKIVQQGYTEVQLPPSSTDFSERRLGITWTGTLILTNGKLRGLETLYRAGDALLNVNEGEIAFTVDLGFRNPTTTHDFRLLFMKREMEGVIIGTITHITFTVVLGLHIQTRKMRLIQLSFKELGHVETDIKGIGPIVDYLASKLSQIMINRAKWEMAAVVEGDIKKMLGDIIGNMKWPLPEQQNLLIGSLKNALGGMAQTPTESEKGGEAHRQTGGGANTDKGGDEDPSTSRKSK